MSPLAAREQHPPGISWAYGEICVLLTHLFLLRQLRLVVRSLSTDATKTLVQAFISNRLDYCNSLLYGITDNLFRRVQAVQNAAARLITGVRRHEHITPVLKQLHWLSVRQRVHFKLAVMVFRGLHGTAPSYLAEDCQLVASTDYRQLHAIVDRRHVPRRPNKYVSRRSFIRRRWSETLEPPANLSSPT